MTNALTIANETVLTFVADAAVPEDMGLKFRTVSEDCMARAVRNVIATDKAKAVYEGKTYDLVLNMTILAVDSLSRDMRDKLEISDIVKDGIASAATKAVNTVKRELCINLVWNGFPVYTNGAQGANFIRSLPSRTEAQENIKRYQAERYVDAAKFRDGKPLAKVTAKAPQNERDAYKLADSPRLVDYISKAAGIAGKVVSWLWLNHRDIFTTLATRVPADHVAADDSDIGAYTDLSQEDRDVIADKVSAKFGATLGEVVEATAKPKAEAGPSRMESFLTWFAKEDIEARAEILRLMNQKHSELSRSATNARKAFGIVTVTADDEDATDNVSAAA